MKPYYNQSAEDVQKQINGGMEPLSDSKVKENQEKYGFNELVEGKKKSTLQIFLEQFKDFLVIILICSAVVSLFLGEAESAAVILVVITMNAILGTVQTIKAEHSLDSLKQLSAPNAKVLRGGIVVEVPSREITVGDEVHLEAGDYVPADGRIIESASLKVDESALTGESIAVEKSSETLEGELPLGDRVNMVYSGSFVTYGYWNEYRGRKNCGTSEKYFREKDTASGKLRSVWTEAVRDHSCSLCRVIRTSGNKRRRNCRCLSFCSGACSSSYSGSFKLDCNNRSCVWYTENGKTGCHHP